jgi:hypothetical protein
VCSAVIRNVRAREIQEAADGWVSAGNSTAMLTITLRHRFEDGLRDSLDLLQRAYRRVTGSTAWRRLLAGYGYVGQIRALEMPWGLANGWHPHAHVLLFLRGRVRDEDLAALERQAFALWEAAVLAEGGRSLVVGRGLRITRGAAAYVAKVQDRDGGWLAGAELARHDLKRGRAGSVMPFELLDREDSRSRALWVEYVEVTRGRRAIFWSKGLRALLGLDVERTDDEVMADTEASDLLLVLDGPDYDGLRDDPRALVAVLEDAEAIARGGESDDETTDDAPAAATEGGDGPVRAARVRSAGGPAGAGRRGRAGREDVSGARAGSGVPGADGATGPVLVL